MADEANTQTATKKEKKQAKAKKEPKPKRVQEDGVRVLVLDIKTRKGRSFTVIGATPDSLAKKLADAAGATLRKEA